MRTGVPPRSFSLEYYMCKHKCYRACSELVMFSKRTNDLLQILKVDVSIKSIAKMTVESG